MNQKLKQINDILHGLIGSPEYVQRWWLSPNINWELKCPQEVWDSGEDGQDEVWNYVLTYGFRGS